MKPNKIDPQKHIGISFQSRKQTITDKDAIVYAISIGFSKDPLREQDYVFTSEANQKFSIFPTIGCAMGVDFNAQLLSFSDFPNYDPNLRLHAEERIEILKPLKTGVQYQFKGTLIDAFDKPKFAILDLETKTYADNELVSIRNSFVIFRGLEGFGFKGKGITTPIPKQPNRQPDVILQDGTYPGQAFLYRLNGDRNLLHIDPKISAIAKFEKPIIHGLASFGIVARVLVQNFLNNDADQIKVYHTRFVSHVFPGQTFSIQVWKEQKHLFFNVIINERKKICLIGYLEWRQKSKL